MNSEVSANTQAILLLTAPLLIGKKQNPSALLTPGEYRRLAARLRELRLQPADLLAANADEHLAACASVIDAQRLRALLGRGFALSQAIEHWHTRAIWVVSRADPEYPTRWKQRLQTHAPAVLYGCGDHQLLGAGGLAIVGSRNADDEILGYAMAAGHLAAAAHRPIISGGARGVDAAGMRGALEDGGTAVGVLADSLERQVMNREHRNRIVDGSLVLVSPYDPKAGFNAGNAMQRNKLIYALSDAALVVEADARKGGTRAGALEQLEKSRWVTVYVRSTGRPSPGLDSLRKKGASDWPNPDSADALADVLATSLPNGYTAPARSDELDLTAHGSAAIADAEMSFESTDVFGIGAGPGVANSADRDATQPPLTPPATDTTPFTHELGNDAAPADRVFASVRDAALEVLSTSMSVEEFASSLDVSRMQAKTWLDRLVTAGVVTRQRNPLRYSRNSQPRLLDP